MCDVDLFKNYNDTYGHPAGDQALRTVAATLVSELRDVDRIYRYGGEEFLVLLPEQDVSGAMTAMERVRAGVESAAVPHPAGLPLGLLTLSAGISGAGPDVACDSGQVLAAADAALYRGKAEGRNRVAASLRQVQTT